MIVAKQLRPQFCGVIVISLYSLIVGFVFGLTRVKVYFIMSLYDSGRFCVGVHAPIAIKFGPWAQDHREYEKSANNARVQFSTY